MRCVLVADHEIPERDPLMLRPGDVVQARDRDTEWPAFVFVTATHGDAFNTECPVRIGARLNEKPQDGHDLGELPSVGPAGIEPTTSTV